MNAVFDRRTGRADDACQHLSAKFKGRLQVFYRVMVQLVIIRHI